MLQIRCKWIVTIGVVVLLDQLSKFLVSYYMILKQPSIDIIPNFLSFSYITNDGIAFGLNPFGGKTLLLLSVIAIFFVAKMLYDAKQTSGLTQFSLSLILGGAIGNFLDRFFTAFQIMNYNGVIDFIYINPFIIDFPYIFNLADSSITIGIFLYIASFLKYQNINAKKTIK
tara:strand:+ start:203 stop:715 length:513 start_codon:yes stop_codon:yes gene_type:complete